MIASGGFLTLTSHTWAVVGLVVLAVAALGAALAGVSQVLVSISNERRRNQPVVIAHDAGNRQFSDRDTPNTVLPTYLTNEGGGTAFNVRFGVDLDGVRYAWKYAESDSDAGSYQRVVGVGDRMPEGAETFRIEIAWEKFVAREGTDERRIYWCRYENAYGKTWETRNAVDRSTGLNIRRVRFLRWRLWREVRGRQKTAQAAQERIQLSLEALAETRNEARR